MQSLPPTQEWAKSTSGDIQWTYAESTLGWPCLVLVRLTGVGYRALCRPLPWLWSGHQRLRDLINDQNISVAESVPLVRLPVKQRKEAATAKIGLGALGLLGWRKKRKAI